MLTTPMITLTLTQRRILLALMIMVLIRDTWLFWYPSEPKQTLRSVVIAAPSSSPPRILYYGVTHHTTVHKAVEADKTWGKRVMPQGMTWYSTAPHPTLKVKVLVPPEGDAYDNLYFRTLLVMKDAYESNPGYDWYVRVWDDNYVIKERMDEIAAKYDPNELVEIGRSGLANGIVYIGGGAASLTSAALMKKNVENMHVCSKRVVIQEDVTIGMCRASLGARFVFLPSFHSLAPREAHEPGKPSLSVYLPDVTCRRPIVEVHDHGPSVPKRMHGPDIPATFHYVSKEGHAMIDKALYVDQCVPGYTTHDAAMQKYGRGEYGEVVFLYS